MNFARYGHNTENCFFKPNPQYSVWSTAPVPAVDAMKTLYCSRSAKSHLTARRITHLDPDAEPAVKPGTFASRQWSLGLPQKIELVGLDPHPPQIFGDSPPEHVMFHRSTDRVWHMPMPDILMELIFMGIFWTNNHNYWNKKCDIYIYITGLERLYNNHRWLINNHHSHDNHHNHHNHQSSSIIINNHQSSSELS